MQALVHERDVEKRDVTVLESKMSSMQHERDVLTKMRAQAEGSTHQQVRLLVCAFSSSS